MITINIDKSNRCAGDYSLYISFPYDATLVGIVREFSSKYWDAQNKKWELPVKSLGKFLEKTDKYEIEMNISDASIFAEKKAEMPASFSFKTQPFQHQIEGFNYGLTHTRWLLGDEQGLGKTKQVIDIAVAKKQQCGYQHCLIICGVNGLKWNWQNEVGIHSDEIGWILGQRFNKKGNIKIGSSKDKLEDLNRLPDAYFLITNVESLRDEAISSKLIELCKSGVIGMIAFDECHKAKNPTSQQGKGILKLSADTMIAMSGTPLMNTPLDLYVILKWLGYENHSFYQFKNHYCVMGGYGGYQVVGYKYLDELQSNLDEVMLRRLKSDVLDLPEKVFIDEYVEMSAPQSKIYKEVTEAIKENIDAVKIAPNPLAQLIRLRQATGYTGTLSSMVKESAKLDRMEDLVEEAVANNRKVVIFSNWTQMTDEVYKRLKSYKPAIITGETSDEMRQSQVQRFQNDRECKVIIGTIGAMGTGLTLTAGTVEIFLDEPWNMALKEQAVDRCHRIGQNDSVTVYTLLTKNTIDERIHNIVYTKGKMSEAIVDGKMSGDIVDYLIDG